VRGLVWTQWYFASDWFHHIEDDDGSRCLEDDSKRQHRAARVLYLGMTLARESSYLCYDSETGQFFATTGSHVDKISPLMSATWLRRDGANDFQEEHTRKQINRVGITSEDDDQMLRGVSQCTECCRL
jgi:hypothetical protein